MKLKLKGQTDDEGVCRNMLQVENIGRNVFFLYFQRTVLAKILGHFIHKASPHYLSSLHSAQVPKLIFQMLDMDANLFILGF